MMRAMKTRTALASLAVVAGLALAGCGDDAETADDTTTPTATPTSQSPSPSESEEPAPEPEGVVAEATIEGDSALPIAEQIELGKGETLTLRITSDRAGELHVHSTPEQVVEFEAGTKDYPLTFDKPGTVDIEEHDTGVLLFRVLVS